LAAPEAIGATVGVIGRGAAVLTEVGVDAAAGGAAGALIDADSEPAAILNRAKAV